MALSVGLFLSASFIVCCVGLCAVCPVPVSASASAADFGRPGFFIGSQPGLSDLVLNGSNPNASPWVLTEQAQSLTLNLYLEHVDGFPDDLFYNFTMEVSPVGWDAIAYVYLSGRVSSYLYAGTAGEEAMLTFICDQNGVQNVTITMDVSDSYNAAYQRIVLSFAKQCQMPLFDVSVVAPDGSGSLQRLWTASQFNGTYYLSRAQSDTFLIGLNAISPVKQHNFTIYVLNWEFDFSTSASPTSFTVQGTGDSAAVSVRFDYACPANEARNHTVYFQLLFEWQTGPLGYIFFQHECNTIQPKSGRVGLSIGSQPRFSDFVSNGAAVGVFNSSNPQYPLVQGEGNQTLTFYLNLEFVQGASSYAYYNMSVVVENPSVADLVQSGMLAGFLHAGLPAEALAWQFTCKMSGLMGVTIRMDVYDNPFIAAYPQLVLSFKKLCQEPAFDVSVVDANSQSLIRLFENNRPATAFVSAPYGLSDVFLVGLNNASAVTQHAVTIQAVNPGRANFVTVTFVNGSGSAAGSVINGAGDGAALPLVLTYNCTGAQFNNTVNLLLKYGWISDYVVSFTKQCDSSPPFTPTPNPAPPGGSDGLSVPALAAAIVVIGAAAFLILGSLYKYCILKQRGWNVLPGISCCRKCCGKGKDSDGFGDLDNQYASMHERDNATVNN